jgi:hypothetical protein
VGVSEVTITMNEMVMGANAAYGPAAAFAFLKRGYLDRRRSRTGATVSIETVPRREASAAARDHGWRHALTLAHMSGLIKRVTAAAAR